MNRLVLGVLAIAICFNVYAQGVGSGGTDKIVDAEHGFSFHAPVGWRVEQINGQCAGFALRDATNTMAIVVKPHHSNSLADFISRESGWSGQKIKYGSKITDLGQGMQYVRAYVEQNGVDVFLDMLFVPMKEKRGVVIVNLTSNQDAAEKAMKYAEAAMTSLEYFAPTLAHRSQLDSPSQSSSKGSQKDQIFAGKKLYFENPRSGAQFVLHFCSNGTYTEIYQGMYSSGTAGDETHGRWGVHESAGNIYLTKNSRKEQKTLLVTEGKRNSSIKLDEMEYAVSESRECR